MKKFINSQKGVKNSKNATKNQKIKVEAAEKVSGWHQPFKAAYWFMVSVIYADQHYPELRDALNHLADFLQNL